MLTILSFISHQQGRCSMDLEAGELTMNLGGRLPLGHYIEKPPSRTSNLGKKLDNKSIPNSNEKYLGRTLNPEV